MSARGTDKDLEAVCGFKGASLCHSGRFVAAARPPAIRHEPWRWSGIDFGQYAPTDQVKKVETNAIHSFVEHIAGGDKSWTIDELAKFGGIGGLGPVFVGSPARIADILQEWVDDTDVDGFNLAYAVTPDSFEDVVGYIVPELQKRGAYPTAYRPGTLREKLFGDGDYLPANHPANRYRDIEAFKREEATAAIAAPKSAAV